MSLSYLTSGNEWIEFCVPLSGALYDESELKHMLFHSFMFIVASDKDYWGCIGKE